MKKTNSNHGNVLARSLINGNWNHFIQRLTSNCLRLPTFCDAPPTPSEFEETTSLLPCKRFTSFWHKSLASAALFRASSVAKNCWTWAFCVQEDILESIPHLKKINWKERGGEGGRERENRCRLWKVKLKHFSS